MNKLRSGQLFAILLLNAASSVLCQTAAFTLEGILGTALGCAVQLALCLPLVLLFRNPNRFPSDFPRKYPWPLLFLVLWLVIRGGSSFVLIQSTSADLSLPFSGKFLGVICIALVCLYTASLGIQALARCSTLIFAILLFTLAVLLIGAIPQAQLQNLSLSVSSTIWKGFLRSMEQSDELVLALLLLGMTKSSGCKPLAAAFTGKFLLYAFVGCIAITVLGSRMTQAEHPFFTVAAVSQPFSTQRADALYLLVFVMLCVFRITTVTALSAHLLHRCFPKLRYTSTLCLLLMLGVAACSKFLKLFGGWNIGFCLLLEVLVLLALAKTSKQKGGSSCAAL